MTDEQPAAVDASPAARGDTGYRRNQLPAGVTMVQVKRRYAAIRIRSSGIGLRTEAGGDWSALNIVSVSRARRPWVLKLELADGGKVFVRPFMVGEAGLPDCGGRVGGIGSSEPLGDDPISAVIAVFAIVFYVLAAPFFLYSNWKRSKVAGRLQAALRVALPPPP